MRTTDFDQDLLANEISSWEAEERPGPPVTSTPVDSTEVDEIPREHAGWSDCFDAVLGLLRDPTGGGIHDEFPPSRESIEGALSWLSAIRRSFPQTPPSLVLADPAGGVIFERRGRKHTGEEVIQEFAFSNHGTAEYTEYHEGRIIVESAIEFHPPSS